MIKIKNLEVLNLHPTLIEIHKSLVGFFAYDGFTIVTSAFRPNSVGVHGTLKVRGLDLRCKDDEIGNQASEYLNSLWVYDPVRPEMKVAIYHDVGQGKHLHLQCHPNTTKV